MKKFKNKNLSVIAFANGFTMWAFNDSSLSLDEIMEKDFFADVWTLMSVGDMILVVCKDKSAQIAVTKLDKESVETKIMSKVEF